LFESYAPCILDRMTVIDVFKISRIRSIGCGAYKADVDVNRLEIPEPVLIYRALFLKRLPRGLIKLLIACEDVKRVSE